MAQRLGSASLALGLILLVVAGCGSSDNAKLTLGGGCTLSSDCAAPLLCKFGRCHQACVESARDCSPGQRCVQVDGAGVCQQQPACAGGCGAPLMCSPDMQCRNLCSAANPCKGTQVCVAIGGGTSSFCADTAETVAGGPGVGGSDAGGPSGATDAGADVPVTPDVGPPAADAGAGKDTAVAPEAGAACGPAGGACCPDMTCQPNLTCSKASARCTCADKCGGWYVLRKDGQIIWNGNNVLKTVDGQIFTAPGALDMAGGYNSRPEVNAGCVVTKEGALWCWGPNTHGQLGAGLTDAASASARQVVNSARTPLLGGRKVAATHSGANFCAIVEEGKVWCWGDGASNLLGPGNTANSNVAVPVLSAPGGAPITGFVDLAMADYEVCGIKTDGSVWCWGYYVSVNPVQINLLDTATSVGCGHIFCCATTTKDAGVSCWNNTAPTTGNKLTYPGGAPVTGITSVHNGWFSGIYPTVHLLKNDLTVLTLFTDVGPLSHKGTAISAPHLMGDGCLITAEGVGLPTDWVPFCE